ncbi:MAG: glycosyltransferase family 9 protein [Chloroflexota bacterium]
MPNGARVPDVRRIAVLRATALGDLIFALPALDSLRAAYPDAEIVLLGRAWHAEYLGGRPGPVDRVVALPKGLPPDDSPPLDAERDRDLLASVAADGIDIALQMHGGGRNSNPVVAALGARVTAGTRTPDAPALDRSIPYVYFQAEVFRNLEIAGLVGAPSVTFEPALTATDADLDAARRQAAPELDHDDVAPLAVIHPGASDGRRRWPATAFAEVADALAEGGARVAVTGIEAEAPIVAEMLAAMRCPAANLAGRLDLLALTGVLSRADVVVSNDTGPLHLAAALGRPTVGIYWCGNVINAGPPFRARQRVLMSWRLRCPVCGVDCMTGTCPHRDSFVADVPAADVARAAVELLAAG